MQAHPHNHMTAGVYDMCVCVCVHDIALLTNLNDKNPELVEIAQAICGETQLPDNLVETFGTSEWILEKVRNCNVHTIRGKLV